MKVVETGDIFVVLITKQDIMNVTISRLLNYNEKGEVAERNAVESLLSVAVQKGLKKGYERAQLLTRQEALSKGLEISSNVEYVLIMKKGGGKDAVDWNTPSVALEERKES